MLACTIIEASLGNCWIPGKGCPVQAQGLHHLIALESPRLLVNTRCAISVPAIWKMRILTHSALYAKRQEVSPNFVLCADVTGRADARTALNLQ